MVETKQFPELQKEFMLLCQQHLATPQTTLENYTHPDMRKVVGLWMNLIDEEVNSELLSHVSDYILHPIPVEKGRQQRLNELADIVDDIADSIYVLCGLANALGLPLTRVFNAVHNANLDKAIDGTIIKRDDGKILKPTNWKPANIQGILEEELLS